MKNTIIFLALCSGLGLSACDNSPADNSPETIVVPVPMEGPAGATGEKGATGQSGDAGIEGRPGKAGDVGIQGEPGKSGGDTNIIIPPPVVDVPPDVVPEPAK
jgi:hypothetical protein